MIVNGIDIDRHTLKDVGLSALREAQGALAHNVGQDWGDVTEEKLLMKLISVEIKRKVKIENIDLAAEKKSEWIVNNWELIDRQAEPLHPLKREE